MSMKLSKVQQQLKTTSLDITHYVDEIKAQPDDFAHKHLEKLKESIENAEDALLNYEFKLEDSAIPFKNVFEVLDGAITYLSAKQQEESKKAEKDDSHTEKANELVVALNAIQHLTAVLQEMQQQNPLRGVDVRDRSYKKGKKSEGVSGEQFEGDERRR